MNTGVYEWCVFIVGGKVYVAKQAINSKYPTVYIVSAHGENEITARAKGFEVASLGGLSVGHYKVNSEVES